MPSTQRRALLSLSCGAPLDRAHAHSPAWSGTVSAPPRLATRDMGSRNVGGSSPTSDRCGDLKNRVLCSCFSQGEERTRSRAPTDDTVLQVACNENSIWISSALGCALRLSVCNRPCGGP